MKNINQDERWKVSAGVGGQILHLSWSVKAPEEVTFQVELNPGWIVNQMVESPRQRPTVE